MQKRAGIEKKENQSSSTSRALGVCARNLIERFFNKTKQWRRGATRYDKLAAYLAFIKLASSLWRCARQPVRGQPSGIWLVEHRTKT
jgi:transposase